MYISIYSTALYIMRKVFLNLIVFLKHLNLNSQIMNNQIMFPCWSDGLWSTPPDSIHLKLIRIKLSWIYLGVYMKVSVWSQSDWAINLIIWVHKNITTDRKCAVAPVRDLRHEETRFFQDPLVPCAYLVKRQLEGALYIPYSYLHKSESLVACKLLGFDRCSDCSSCSSGPSRYLRSYKVSQLLLGKA